MFQHISSAIKQHLTSFPHNDQIIFNHKTVNIHPERFQLISSSARPPPIIAFLDGGQAEILNGGNFCLSFIRLAATLFQGIFQGKEKKGLVKKGLVKNEFYLFTKAVWKNNDLFYESLIFPLPKAPGQKEKLIEENDVAISSSDSTLRIGHERAPLARVASLARRFAELALARQVTATRAANFVILDGTLEATFTGEEKFLQQLPLTVAALAKTSSLFTTSGNNPIVLLGKLAPPACWSYLVEHHTYFVRLHPQARHVFRFEGNQEVLPFLVEQSQDAVFLGYPYGLILADQLARVSKAERNSLQMNFLLRKENKEIVEYLQATNAHEILDRLG